MAQSNHKKQCLLQSQVILIDKIRGSQPFGTPVPPNHYFTPLHTPLNNIVTLYPKPPLVSGLI
jgi:hypothetical protein